MSIPYGPVLQCQSCEKTFPLDAPVWQCSCGGVIDVSGTTIFPKERLAERPQNFWRYRESLALPDEVPSVSLGEVMPPLLKIVFRGWRVALKLEYLLPTGSYKDRGTAVCMTHLAGQGVRRVAEDSSGNAGASTAAYAAAASIHADVYVPAATSPAKIGQIRMYGAQCHLVPGTRHETAAQARVDESGRRYIGHSWNPLFACGIKSVAYEIAEQSGWRPPDWVVTPAGGGSLVMGLIDGFDELLAAGYVRTRPRILAVQSAACDPIHQAWIRNDAETTDVQPSPTVAEGVSLPDPPRGTQAVQAIRQHDGAVVAVDDDALLSCWHDMAQRGIFMEPTSAVAVAGAWLARDRCNLISARESVVILITGHGLKTKPPLMNTS